MSNEETKARELVEKFIDIITTPMGKKSEAKQCAVICCREILSELPTEILDTYKGETNFITNDRCEYWQQVILHIEKL